MISQNGFTPLMVACKNGHMDVVMALLDANAKTDHAENAVCSAVLCLFFFSLPLSELWI